MSFQEGLNELNVWKMEKFFHHIPDHIISQILDLIYLVFIFDGATVETTNTVKSDSQAEGNSYVVIFFNDKGRD